MLTRTPKSFIAIALVAVIVFLNYNGVDLKTNDLAFIMIAYWLFKEKKESK